jgi:hypothetical protein
MVKRQIKRAKKHESMQTVRSGSPSVDWDQSIPAGAMVSKKRIYNSIETGCYESTNTQVTENDISEGMRKAIS